MWSFEEARVGSLRIRSRQPAYNSTFCMTGRSPKLWNRFSSCGRNIPTTSRMCDYHRNPKSNEQSNSFDRQSLPLCLVSKQLIRA